MIDVECDKRFGEAPQRIILKEHGEHNLPKTGIYYFTSIWYFLKTNNARLRVEEVPGWPHVGSTWDNFFLLPLRLCLLEDGNVEN